MKIRNKSNKKIIFKDIEIAQSYVSRMKGLSGREELGCDGLMMAFPYEGRHSIWMPNMKFAIDIVYISGDGRIVDIKQNAKPLSFNPMTWRVFWPKEKAKYILETAANSSKGRMKIGDALDFDIMGSK